MGAVRDQHKFRIVVVVGRRYDLLAKTADRGSILWPKWSQLVVQLKKRDTQSHKVRPAYAVVIAPASDVGVEPTSIVLPKDSGALVARECLNLRCTESNCPYRKAALDAKDAQAVDRNDEIGEEDRVNILESMLGEADEIEEMQQQDMGGDTEVEEGKPRKHDCIVNLWPYAHTTTYYREVLSSLASADKASVAVILSTTAHPAHWMACVSLVLVCPAKVIEAYDVSQGSAWHDGLNRCIPGEVLAANSAQDPFCNRIQKSLQKAVQDRPRAILTCFLQ